MPCVFSPNLRLLFSPLRPSLAFPLFISKPKPKPYSLFTVLSSSSSGQKQPTPYRNSLNLTRRNSSTFKENKDTGKEVVMDETKSSSSSFGFNKRRAEGKDKNDRPKKNLQLKSRTLNPTNTIAYVQVIYLFNLYLFFCLLWLLLFWDEHGYVKLVVIVGVRWNGNVCWFMQGLSLNFVCLCSVSRNFGSWLGFKYCQMWFAMPKCS